MKKIVLFKSYNFYKTQNSQFQLLVLLCIDIGLSRVLKPGNPVKETVVVCWTTIYLLLNFVTHCWGRMLLGCWVPWLLGSSHCAPQRSIDDRTMRSRQLGTLCNTVSHFTVLHSVTLHCVTLCYTALCYTVLRLLHCVTLNYVTMHSVTVQSNSAV